MKHLFFYAAAIALSLTLAQGAEAAAPKPAVCPPGQALEPATARCVSEKALEFKQSARLRLHKGGEGVIEADTGTFQTAAGNDLNTGERSSATTSGSSTLGGGAGTHMNDTISTF
ncbi:MAG TPA: hypothetical protein VL688_01080 [Verrucomicrobiae bacterium]|jgi:hypothetical protein|nr:hypothetical protein [Verrucomicrobiae bacterium]